EPVAENPVEKIHIYPNIEGNYSTKALLLEKGKMQFDVKATDRNYYKASLEGKDITYRIENEGSSNIGTITNDGLFTANTGTGKGKVIASVGDIEAAYEIELVDEITSIETDVTILS